MIASKPGAIVVGDGVGDVLAQTVIARVVGAHGALQFGELAHHISQ